MSVGINSVILVVANAEVEAEPRSPVPTVVQIDAIALEVSAGRCEKDRLPAQLRRSIEAREDGRANDDHAPADREVASRLVIVDDTRLFESVAAENHGVVAEATRAQEVASLRADRTAVALLIGADAAEHRRIHAGIRH